VNVIENSKYLYLTQLRYKLKLKSRLGVGDWKGVFFQEDYKWLIEGEKDNIVIPKEFIVRDVKEGQRGFEIEYSF